MSRTRWRWLLPLGCALVWVLLALHRSERVQVGARYSLAWFGVLLAYAQLCGLACLLCARAAWAERIWGNLRAQGLLLACAFPLGAGTLCLTLGGAPAGLAACALGGSASLLLLLAEHPRRALLRLGLILGVSLPAADALLLLLRHNPGLARGPLQELARALYLHDRAVPQLLPEAARFDPELGYLLQPERRFAFRASEFDVTVATNALGARDDEDSLEAPPLIVLGDSHAWGWGVPQEACFPRQLEAQLGERVLNLAVPSYGTARALGLLRRADRSRLRTLVVQYCPNDDPENQAFLANGRRLPPLDAGAYQRQVARHARARRFIPLRALSRALAPALRRALAGGARGLGLLEPPPPARRSPAAQAEAFLEVLATGPPELARCRLVVLALDAWNADTRPFLEALGEAARAPRWPAFIRRLETMPTPETLSPAHGFVLDEHLRASGHRLLAERLAQQLGRSPR